jgi:very-short-patch-repair endonuclease
MAPSDKDSDGDTWRDPTQLTNLPSPLVGEGARRADEGEKQKLSPRLRATARRLRRQQTPHEALLWSILRDRRFVDYKFRRQVPIGPYVADFACYDAKLIVELDGSQHAENDRDVQRDAELARRGFRVLRIWNGELLTQRQAVLEAIIAALERR